MQPVRITGRYDFEVCISGHNKPQKKEILARMEQMLEDSWKKQTETIANSV